GSTAWLSPSPSGRALAPSRRSCGSRSSAAPGSWQCPASRAEWTDRPSRGAVAQDGAHGDRYQRGMEGSHRRILQLRTAVPTLVLVAVVAVTGCGGGGGSSSAEPAAALTQPASAPGGVVAADGTQTLVGPTGRATSTAQQ